MDHAEHWETVIFMADMFMPIIFLNIDNMEYLRFQIKKPSIELLLIETFAT